MLVKQIPGATLYYRASDAATVAEFESLYADVVRMAREKFGIEPPATLKVYVIHSWPEWLLRTGGLLVWLVHLFRLPHWWYMFSFSGGWRHLYAGIVPISMARAKILVKSLRKLPSGLPPHVHASWEGEPKLLIDRHTLWRREIVGAIVQACCGIRLPRWLVRGVVLSIARPLVHTPSPPQRWQPIFEWAGVDATPLWDLRNLERLPQDKVDELAGVHEWPYWAVAYVEILQPGLLRQLIAAGLPRPKLEQELAARLGMATGQFWESLAAEATSYFERDQVADIAPLEAPPDAARSPEDHNPYAAPVAVPSTMSLRRPTATQGFLTGIYIGAAIILFCIPMAIWFYWVLTPGGVRNAPLIAMLLIVANGLLTFWVLQVLDVTARVLIDLVTGKYRQGKRDG